MQTKGVQSRLVGGVHARMGMNLTAGNARYSDFATVPASPTTSTSEKATSPAPSGCSPER